MAWRNSFDACGLGVIAPLEWVAWFDHQRLLEPIGDIPPAEAEAAYYHQLTESPAIA